MSTPNSRTLISSSPRCMRTAHHHAMCLPPTTPNCSTHKRSGSFPTRASSAPLDTRRPPSPSVWMPVVSPLASNSSVNTDTRGNCSALLNASRTRLCARLSQMLDNQDTPWHTSASWPRRARDPPLCDVPSRPYAGTDDADELLADLAQMVENVIRHTAERLSRGERRGDWSEMLQGAQKATRGALQQP